MKKLLLLIALLAGIATAQTTTPITGTIKDLTNAVVTSGEGYIHADAVARYDHFRPGAVFTPHSKLTHQRIGGDCRSLWSIGMHHYHEHRSAAAGQLLHRGHLARERQNFDVPGVLSSYDWSTVVPTPTTSPAQNFVDFFSNQTIAGNKIWSGTHVFNGSVSFPGTITGTTNAVLFNPQNLNGSIFSDQSASLNAAIATMVSNGTGGNVYMPPGFNATLSGSSTLQLGDGNVPVVL